MLSSEKALKKFFLTSFVLVAFVLYSLNQRYGESRNIKIAPPVTTQATTNTPSQSSNSTPMSSGMSNSNSGSSQKTMGMYRDGQYTGTAADAFYGYIQVEAIISGGKLTDVQFLQYPNDRSTSVYINSQAMPYLKQEALQAQSSNVNIISGASDSSQAFIQSLSSALAQAHL